MTLCLQDTLAGHPVPLRRRPGRAIDLYVCGPTVYDAAHVGHARTYLYFDVLRRTLEADGLRVRHVMNITDFEDKIDQRAAKLGTTWRSLARQEERAFFVDMDSLGLLRPHFRPRASDYVDRMANVIRRLEKTGRVHRSGEEWIYSPPKRRPRENFPTGAELAAHAVLEADQPFPTLGEGAGDFMIWRRQEPPLASFRGPWGRGIPGWHLECFAMAEHLLGLPVDLHGGGRDLVYPHHYAENEIALATHHVPFARVFLHTAFVTQDGRKMSKSTGNLVPIRTAVSTVGPGALRWHLISRPYTQRLEWHTEELRRASDEYERVRSSIQESTRAGASGALTAKVAADLAKGVQNDLSANLGTDHAIARLAAFADEWAAKPNARPARGELARVRAAFREVEDRLGLPLL